LFEDSNLARVADVFVGQPNATWNQSGRKATGEIHQVARQLPANEAGERRVGSHVDSQVIHPRFSVAYLAK